MPKTSFIRVQPERMLFPSISETLILLLVLSSCTASILADDSFFAPSHSIENYNSGNIQSGSFSSQIDLDLQGGQDGQDSSKERVKRGQSKPHASDEHEPRGRLNDKKQMESPTKNCTDKRIDILRRQSSLSHKSPPHQASQHNANPTSSGFQKLRPRHENKHSHTISNETIDEIYSSDSEHVPQCTQTGKYEPIQCHVGYCWCVNKYGQAIKKSSAPPGMKPLCDSSMYESESNDALVVTGVTTSRMKAGGFLKDRNFESSHALSGLEADSDSLDQDMRLNSKDQESEFNRRVSTSQEPSLSLVPNECTLSRVNAKERASRHTDDSIWIPECDSENEKLYAEKQCHKSKVCWCVDQVTGLPLRTNEQLAKQTTINCTDIKSIIDIASTFAKQNTKKSLFFHGFSVYCDAHRRVEFVHSLIGQFRQQLSEYKRFNPLSSPPEGLSSSNPFRLSESHVSRWKFAIMDADLDGKLNDREWSKFKNNFKLVDRFEDIQRLDKFQSSVTPLIILRTQRRCWRDFLQFCGDLLNAEPISLSKWLSCTEIPSEPDLNIETGKAPDIAQMGSDSVEAAIARSKKPNPFLGILKPN